MLLASETIIITVGDYERSEQNKLFSGPVYYSALIIGLIARFLFGLIIMIMLFKNEDSKA